ncbi:hypothetical protein ACFPFP_02910 [Bradyrhizobium sp. GCM10023182]|uniref:Uncharacterized protein n=1 Tax=Bradyrhizobium zhengyangense TaxID=2911009 RepID=A0ABS9LFT9_9BRAD|nr:hypothetical protein [Bradyrhizobium zhengyangense]MCG2665879.1 hypothetical protein [Bradyrhizobium zhengyangense]
MTSPVLEALLLAKVDDMIVPPHSWGKQEKLMFLQLPHALRLYYSEREKERDRRVLRAMNEAADARKRVAEVQAELDVCKAKLTILEEKNAEAKDVAA